MAMVVISANALADWVEIGKNEYPAVTEYFEPNTILNNGGKVQMWTLLDFQKQQKMSSSDGLYMSMKTLNEYDCKKGVARFLAGQLFSKNMGSGELIFDDPHQNDKWIPIPPKSNGESLKNLACGKK